MWLCLQILLHSDLFTAFLGYTGWSCDTPPPPPPPTTHPPSAAHVSKPQPLKPLYSLLLRLPYATFLRALQSAIWGRPNTAGPYHGGAGADPPPFSNLFAPQGVSQLKLPLLVLHSGAGPAGPLRARLHIRTGFRRICDRNKCDCDS